MNQKRFYNSTDPSYLRHGKNIPYARYMVGKLLEALPSPRRRVLEVGAGQGRFTLELARHVDHLHATDLSKKEISLARECLAKLQDTLLKKTRITTRVVDLLSKRDNIYGVYDYIVGFFVLHHIDRFLYPRVAARLKKHLRGGGRLSFIEPNSLYPFHLVEMAIVADMRWEIEKQIYSDYIGRWVGACQSIGLKKVIVKKFGFTPPPLINLWPGSVILDRVVEAIPFLREVCCPFILLSFEK